MKYFLLSHQLNFAVLSVFKTHQTIFLPTVTATIKPLGLGVKAKQQQKKSAVVQLQLPLSQTLYHYAAKLLPHPSAAPAAVPPGVSLIANCIATWGSYLIRGWRSKRWELWCFISPSMTTQNFFFVLSASVNKPAASGSSAGHFHHFNSSVASVLKPSWLCPSLTLHRCFSFQGSTQHQTKTLLLFSDSSHVCIYHTATTLGVT